MSPRKPKIIWCAPLNCWVCVAQTQSRELTVTSGDTPKEAFDKLVRDDTEFTSIPFVDQVAAKRLDENWRAA